MAFWSWSGTATQSNAAGGTVLIDFTAGAGNRMKILAAQGIGIFAAADTLEAVLQDEDGTIITFLCNVALGGAGTANATIPRAGTNVDSSTDTTLVSSLDPPEIAGPDLKYVFQTTALAQNDTVAVRLWAWVDKGPGAVSVARSGGTVAAPTVTVNEVY